MNLILTIVFGFLGFAVEGVLSLVRIIFPIPAIDRMRTRILTYMVCLGTGVDDAAVARLRTIDSAETTLEQMASPGGRAAIVPEMVLQMLRAGR